MENSLPLVSLIIMSYNQAAYIRSAVAAALAQDYENLEIVFADDCSTDGTNEIISQEVGKYDGSHHVYLHRNSTNLGIGQNASKSYADCAHGEYIMFGGGDDILLPTSVSYAVEKIRDSGVYCMCFNQYVIDAEGKRIRIHIPCDDEDGVEIYGIENFLNKTFKSTGACRIMKKDVFSFFGPYQKQCPTEDTTNNMRSFLLGPVGYCHRPNNQYRIHGGNASGLRNLMTHFDPKAIYDQYVADIGVAVDKKAISKELAARLYEWCEKYLRLQRAYRTVYKLRFLPPKWVAGIFSIYPGYAKADVGEIELFAKTMKYWNG